MDDSRENAIEENVDLFVNRYRPLANNFGFVKGFLSAAVGHAASTSDRTVVRELLLDAAAALDRHEKWRSRHSRPAPWMPIDGEPGAAALSAEEVAGTLSTMHEARPNGERDLVNTAALCAAFIMLGWHDHKAAASVLQGEGGRASRNLKSAVPAPFPFITRPRDASRYRTSTRGPSARLEWRALTAAPHLRARG